MKKPCGIVWALALIIVTFAGWELLAQGTDPLVGTWKLNVAKSRFNPGPPLKSGMKKFEAARDGLKFSGQDLNADGTKLTVQWTAYFDGKDYPIKGDPNADTLSLKRIDRFKTESTFKKAGKVTYRVKRVVSQDGKAWQLSSEGKDSKGKSFSDVLVFDKR
jgi:hypothetical protein